MANRPKKKEEMGIPKELPLIPLRDLIIFPNLVVPLFVGRDKSIRALEAAMREEHMVALAVQRDVEVQDPLPEDLYDVGSVAIVMQELKLPDGTAKALVEGMVRIKIKKFIQVDPYFKVEIEVVEEKVEKDIETEALMRTLISQFEECARLGKPIPPEVLIASLNISEPGRLADFVAFHLNLKTDGKQEILEAIDPKDRLAKVSTLLLKELEILELGSKIQSRIKDQMTQSQKEYFLKEQLRAIQQELGMADERTAESLELKDKIEKAKMTAEAKEKALSEVDRLEKMPPAAAEAAVIRTYLDWLIGLPWKKKSKEKLDIVEAAKILDDYHYGLDKVKERILEHLAVRKLAKGKSKEAILCFVGPPGTGKTSIGRAIAKSLGREFIRVSLGGVRDEAEIRGHRRTYVGALPGRIVQNIKQVGTNNPVFMMDEIDKVGADFRGDPTAALLEVLDPEQNYAFSDHYLEIPFDLSDVMFITTANLLDTIPPALRDRMEVIHFSGYTEEEKVRIAEEFLIPKQLAAHGLEERGVTIEGGALVKVIREQTREAGVRNLDRKLATIFRQIARKIVEGKKDSFRVKEDDLNGYLGPAQFHYGIAEKADEIGVATGLAWTETGGDIISVEATLMKGNGKLILTGQLGDVMQESAQAALSFIRSNGKTYGLAEDFYSAYDIHIHVPAGAIPKDGPSAGITMATALISALTRAPIKKDVGMTGEITLRGRVLPIGGLKEKVLAAHRAGLKHLIVPKDNEKDLTLVSDEVKKELNFTLVENVSEVFTVALDKPLTKEGKTVKR